MAVTSLRKGPLEWKLSHKDYTPCARETDLDTGVFQAATAIDPIGGNPAIGDYSPLCNDFKALRVSEWRDSKSASTLINR